MTTLSIDIDEHSAGYFSLFGSTGTPDDGIANSLKGLLNILRRLDQGSQKQILRLDFWRQNALSDPQLTIDDCYVRYSSA